MINICTNLCSAFRKLGRGQRIFLGPSSSQLPSAQNYLYAKGEDLGIFWYPSAGFTVKFFCFAMTFYVLTWKCEVRHCQKGVRNVVLVNLLIIGLSLYRVNLRRLCIEAWPQGSDSTGERISRPWGFQDPGPPGVNSRRTHLSFPAQVSLLWGNAQTMTMLGSDTRAQHKAPVRDLSKGRWD